MKNIFFSFLFLYVLFSCNIGACSSLERIRYESLLPSRGEKGLPLPLAAHWNSGKRPGGFSPEFQLELLKAGHHILPWFQLDDPGQATPSFSYEKSLKFAAQHGLPISFIGSQWEKLLTIRKEYFSLPAILNPNVVLLDGSIEPAVSPFGPVKPWGQVGLLWTDRPVLKKLQELYENPPLVLFVSNNEHTKLKWDAVEKSHRYMQMYGPGHSDEFKRQIVGDAWIERYKALFNGMRNGLIASAWKEHTIFIGYDAFPDGSLWRWGGWPRYALHIPGRFEPWSSVWDGASVSFYTHDWDPSVDFTVWSPQIRAMNLVCLLQDVYQDNPNYWFELSIWDGSQPKRPESDKRRYYASLGQTYSPERYGGMVQFGMWLLRPRVVREFRGWTETVKDTGIYFGQILNAVDRIYNNQILEKFWRNGTLVPNRNGQHPHQSGVPEEYRGRDRWFLLDTNLDPRKPWTLETEVPVFSLALIVGERPDREWLVYAFAPLVVERDVKVQIPEYGQIAIRAGAAGCFYHIQEQSNAVMRVE